jgi:hypothetical protein
VLFRNVGKRLPEFMCHMREDSLVWLMGDNFSEEYAVSIFRVEQRGPEILCSNNLTKRYRTQRLNMTNIYEPVKVHLSFILHFLFLIFQVDVFQVVPPTNILYLFSVFSS